MGPADDWMSNYKPLSDGPDCFNGPKELMGPADDWMSNYQCPLKQQNPVTDEEKKQPAAPVSDTRNKADFYGPKPQPTPPADDTPTTRSLSDYANVINTAANLNSNETLNNITNSILGTSSTTATGNLLNNLTDTVTNTINDAIGLTDTGSGLVKKKCVAVTRKADDLVSLIVTFVKLSKSAYENGFNGGKEFPLQLTNALTQMMKALSGISELKAEASEAKAAFLRSWTLGGVDIIDEFL